MMLDLKKLFPNSKFPTAEELKAKEDSFSIGDRVKVADNIRCRQNGQIGTIVRIDPEDKHGWKSFIVKFDDEKYNSMGFNSGDIDKINEKETTMKKISENQKVTLTLGQLKRLVKETKEWKSRWDAIDGHPNGGEMNEEFYGYCDSCDERVDDPSRLGSLWGWLTNHYKIRTLPDDDWNRVDSIVGKMDDDTYDEFESEIDNDDDDYCEYCAIDKLEELAKQYVE